MAPEMVPDIVPNTVPSPRASERADTGADRANGAVHADRPQRLKRRVDFLAAAAGIKAPAKGLVLQVRARPDSGAVRLGFTVSKRVGNAVERNRVRRRLREVARLNAAGRLKPGHDYVLIGRRAALDVPFARLVEDFKSVLSRVARAGTADTGHKPAASGVRSGHKPETHPETETNPETKSGTMASKR
jgi:ribonuclease P protein component